MCWLTRRLIQFNLACTAASMEAWSRVLSESAATLTYLFVEDGDRERWDMEPEPGSRMEV